MPKHVSACQDLRRTAAAIPHSHLEFPGAQNCREQADSSSTSSADNPLHSTDIIDTTAPLSLSLSLTPSPPRGLRHPTMPPKSGKAAQGRSAIEDVVAREYTIHLHKHVRSV